MARDAEFYLQKAGEFEAAGDAEKAQVMRNAANSFTNPEPERFPQDEGIQESAYAEPLPEARTREEYTAFGQVQQDIDHTTLHENVSWVNASRDMYDRNKGVKTQAEIYEDLSGFEGDTYEQRMADYGLKQMAEYNFNLGKQALDTYQIHNADQRSKEAFVYMMDQYDEVNSSWHTAGQAGWEMLTDATNWLGLATLGTASVAAAGVRLASKEAVVLAVKNSIANNTAKLAIKTGINTSAKRAAASGAVWGGGSAVAFDNMQQNVRVDAGSQDEYDLSQTLLTGAIGLGAGAVLGTGIDLGLSKIGSKLTQRKYANEILPAHQKVIKAQLEHDQQVAAKIKRDLARPAKENKGKQESEFLDLDLDAAVVKIGEGLATSGSVGFNRLSVSAIRKKAGTKESIKEQDLVDAGADDMLSRLKSDPNAERLIIQEFTSGHRTPAQNAIISETAAKSVMLIRGEVAEVTELLLQKDLSKTDAKFLGSYLDKLNGQEISTKNIYDSIFAYNGRNLQIAQKYGVSSKDKTKGLDKQTQAMIKVHKAELDSLEAKYSPKVNEAMTKGNFKELESLLKLHEAEALPVRALIGETQLPKSKQHFKKLTEQYVEASIAGVFSPSTVMVNTIWPTLKTLTYPIVDNLGNSPLALEKWALTAKTYAMMGGQVKAAFQAAKVAFKDESTYLTMDTNRFLDGGIKIKGRVAGAGRFFPRALSATDAFNQELAAAGFLTAKASENLFKEGIEAGLKGKRLKNFVDKNIEQRIKEGYDFDVGMEALKPLFAKAESLTPSKLISKLKGESPEAYEVRYSEAKIAYVMKQIRTSPNKFKQAMFGRDAGSFKRLVDKDAVDYVEQLLYKKEFQKEGAEGMFDWIEKAHREHPILKLFGQLFFRTPVWVMHEAWRLTPAANALLPNFRADIAGHNGAMRQARARTEANLANAIMLWGVSKWAQGELSGSPDADWKKTAGQEVSGLQDLNVMFGDTSVDYRKFEPFRIPLTMIANTMDSFIEVQDKQVQGYEDVDSALMQGFGIALATTVSAFRDSALLTGVYDTFSAGTRAVTALTGDAEDRADAKTVVGGTLLKKGLMPFPSVIKKAFIADGQDQLTSIKTSQQRFLSLVAPNDVSIPRKYDPLGVIREVDNPAYALSPFVASSREQREGRRTKKQQYVVDHMAELERKGYGNFSNHKTRVSWMDEDTREVYTTYEGYKISMHDAVMLEYGKMNAANTYYNILQRAGSLGRADKSAYYGTVVTELKKSQAAFKAKALEIVIKRDQNLLDKRNKRKSDTIQNRLLN